MKPQIIRTDDSIAISTSENIFQAHIGTPAYGKLEEMISKNNYDGLQNIFDISHKLREYAKGCFACIDGVLYFRGIAIPNELNAKILQFCDADISPYPLIRFWENLVKNPDKDIHSRLYSFLQHNGISITNDGCFVCYKRVKDDYFDLYSQKYDNHPGQVITMARENINSSSSVTCSAGLHAAAYHYAKECYHSGSGRLVEVKINPMNVVAIPDDYNQEKMRVCEYTVVRDCNEEYVKPLYDYDDSACDDLDDIDEDTEFGDIDFTVLENRLPFVKADKVKKVTVQTDDTTFIVAVDFRNRFRIPKAATGYLECDSGCSLIAIYDSKNRAILVQPLKMPYYELDTKSITVPFVEYQIDCYGNARISLNQFEKFVDKMGTKKNLRIRLREPNDRSEDLFGDCINYLEIKAVD